MSALTQAIQQCFEEGLGQPQSTTATVAACIVEGVRARYGEGGVTFLASAFAVLESTSTVRQRGGDIP